MIIDYFPFFIEKELLELRINLLKDHVDKFIISEINKTHTGEEKEFICKKTISELNLPVEKIQVIETYIPDDVELIPEECDLKYCSHAKSTKVNNWIRERIQRDALMSVIHEFNENDIFISSDCDEIINPNYIPLFSDSLFHPNMNNSIIKVPLVLLERKADKRVFQDNLPVPWENSLVFCLGKHFMNGGSPQKFRGGCENPYFTMLIVDMNGKKFEDCGWHFTWMGDETRIKYKAKSLNLADSTECETGYSFASSSTIKITDSCVQENFSNRVLRDYPHDLLPQILFELPNVKNFLL